MDVDKRHAYSKTKRYARSTMKPSRYGYGDNNNAQIEHYKTVSLRRCYHIYISTNSIKEPPHTLISVIGYFRL